MNNFKTNLDRLISRKNETLAKQGLNTNDKFPGTFCRTQAFEANPELFYLVLDKVQDGYFKVIPGNLDGFTAGPEDLVLPRNIWADMFLWQQIWYVRCRKQLLANVLRFLRKMFSIKSMMR